LGQCSDNLATYIPLSFEDKGAPATIAEETILVDGQFADAFDIGHILHVVAVHSNFVRVQAG
jgi:hypothetical protein